jgi:hypothetical protein
MHAGAMVRSINSDSRQTTAHGKCMAEPLPACLPPQSGCCPYQLARQILTSEIEEVPCVVQPHDCWLVPCPAATLLLPG